MPVTETSQTGFFGNLKNAIGGALIGLVMVVGAFALLWWNEGRAAKTYAALAELREAVVRLSEPVVDPANQGRPVHVTARAQTPETLEESQFGLTSDEALRLRREVEMYQWVEEEETRTERTAGGGERRETTYRYHKEWVGSPVDSSGFRQSEGHRNPPMPFDSQTVDARRARMGQFQLGLAVIGELSDFQRIALPADAPAPEGYRIHRGGLYKGADPGSPAIGDLRVFFSQVREGPVSVLAQQDGQGFARWAGENGKSFLLARTGRHSAKTQIDARESTEGMITWGVRAGGFLAMWLGLAALFRPLSALVNILPFAGGLVGSIGCAVALVVAAALSLVTIALAWLAYRPLLGGGLLAAAAAIGVLALLLGRKGKQRALGTPAAAGAGGGGPPPPPPPGG